MDKFKENNLILEWIRNANKEYVYQLLELSKSLNYLLTSYSKD
jgi:hypothetical protein